MAGITARRAKNLSLRQLAATYLARATSRSARISSRGSLAALNIIIYHWRARRAFRFLLHRVARARARAHSASQRAFFAVPLIMVNGIDARARAHKRRALLRA